jgi:hypothetical protein
MADEEAVTEDSLFEGAIEDLGPVEKAPVEKAPVERAPEDTAKPVVEAKAERPEVDDDAPQVPSWRVREINEEKRAAIAERDALKAERDKLATEQAAFRRHIQSQQEKTASKDDEPKAPDPLIDPEGYQKFIEQRFDARLLNERRESSLQLARRTYKEEFDEAYNLALERVDDVLRARMQKSADPGETLMQWHRENKLHAEVGTDPAAYRKKLREDLLKDDEFRKEAMAAWRDGASTTDATGRPLVRLAPSLNGVSRSNALLRSSQQDLSDDALFDDITG